MKNLLFLLAIPFLFSACSSDSKNVKPVDIRFLETYITQEIAPYWNVLSTWIQENDSILLKHKLKINNLNSLIQNDMPNCVGTVLPQNVASINSLLALPEIKKLFPEDLRFMWSLEAGQAGRRGDFKYTLYSVKASKNDHTSINGKQIKEAVSSVDQNSNMVIIMITMKEKGAIAWAEMTEKNIGKCIAITIDDKVLSCPFVQNAITGGETQISGDFTIEEAERLVDGINAGR